jgi:hypothetical protein
MAFGACTGTDLIAGFADWVEVLPSLTASSGHVAVDGVDSGGGGYYNDLAIDPTADWTYQCTFQYTGTLNLHVGFSGSFNESAKVNGRREANIGLGATNDEWFLPTQGDADDSGTYSEVFDESVDIDLELVWDQASTTLTATLTQGAHTETLTSFDPYDAGGTAPYQPFISAGVASPDATADFTYFCVTAGAAGPVDPDIIGAFTGHVSSIPEITGSIASIPQFTGIITTRGTP